ncbi:hypothetical protein FOA52_001212 [Chlamydomonas sp. UWO 241]|nr:hypothetical protein FOA52_001212 [Chlamydomonas sp. UWO 241]
MQHTIGMRSMRMGGARASGRVSVSAALPPVRLALRRPRHQHTTSGRRALLALRAQVADQPAATEAAAAPTGVVAGSIRNEDLPTGALVYTEPTGMDMFLTSCRLAFALPWRRFKKGSVLVMKLEGDISDQMRGRFDSGLSVPQICAALQKAALDPRIKGVAIEVGPLGTGWAKLQELRRHITYFRESGKFTMAYMKVASEKEYYLASACADVYTPPSASLSLRGFAVGGTFLRGVLDKVGVEPQVKRIGKYKSAGDQLLRRDMSEPQAEQLGALLDDIYDEFVTVVASARGKTVDEVKAMLEEGIYDMQKFMDGGWVTALRYEDEVIEDLKARTDTKEDKPLKKVELRKYSKVNPSAFGLGGGKKRIVVLRTSGAIVGKASGTGGTITPDGIIPILRALAKDKGVAAVVLRVDSPGGDALASDLMWREIRLLAAKKPVVASMGDVAASGGYYMAMGCGKIVAEALTITGSIGVVTGKFNLSKLFEKVGYSKTLISKGRYAELMADNRPFSGDELKLFDESAEHAYASFRDKAASSRGMSIEAMQAVAQGRVWTGRAALEIGLVDALGGVARAVAVAKKLAEIADDEKVRVSSIGSVRMSPLALLSGGAAASAASPAGVLGLVAAALASATGGASSASALGGDAASAGVAGALASAFAAQLPLLTQLSSGRVSYVMTDVDVGSLGSQAAAGSSLELGAGSSSVRSFLEEGEEGGLAGGLWWDEAFEWLQ